MLKNNTNMEVMVTAFKRCAVLLVSSLCLSGIAYAGVKTTASPLVTGTYSNFEYNQEAGDLNGVEVRLILTRKGVKGVVQFAEGGAGDLALVDVSVTDTHIHFEMPSGFQTEGTFDGTISAKGLEGTFRYKGGAQERVVLPRTQSYWDRRR